MRYEEYNGYTNYITWLVFTLLDNEEKTQKMLYYWSMEILDGFDGDKDQATDLLAEWLEDYVEENRPMLPDFYDSLLEVAICEIDYKDIAEALIEDNYLEYMELYEDEQ